MVSFRRNSDALSLTSQSSQSLLDEKSGIKSFTSRLSLRAARSKSLVARMLEAERRSKKVRQEPNTNATAVARIYSAYPMASM
jgi:hypothetical protein